MDLKSGGQNKPVQPADKRLDDYYNKPSRQEALQQDVRSQEQQEREARHASQIGEVIISWEAPEFEVYEKSSRWYLIAGLLVVGMAIWGLVSNSPIMSITFILVGIVGYIQLQRPPAIRTFSATTTGVLVSGKEFYPYENIKSFWIFYDPPHTKTISLHTSARVFPYVHMPLGGADPVALHRALTQYIPEIEQNHSLIDTIERVLHI